MMRQAKRSIIFRATPRGSSNLPLGVRSTGRYRIAQGWMDKRLQKWFAQLFWIVEGTGEFALEDKAARVCAGQIFLYRPGDIHEVRPLTPFWEYCWLTLDHPDIVTWLDGFGLEGRIYSPGTCPARLFAQLATCLQECTPQGERRAAQIAHAILLAASSQIGEPNAGSAATRARHLLDANFDNPSWSIADVVEKLKVHRTTLLRSFLKDYGMTPSRYLQNRRIQKALSLLRENELQIQEVAWQAGFSDSNYLARAVRAATGMTPRQFRRR